MLQIEKTLISLDICDKHFECDLNKCKGACCVQGDSGAPLTSAEINILEEYYPIIREFLEKKGSEVIDSVGVFMKDSDGDTVTPLINNQECAYAVFEDGIAKCGIEKAFQAKAIPFQKPLSCHLYPIRITKYSSFDALNYHQWDICKPARKKGIQKNTFLYVFLKNPLIREYGKNWYEQLKIASEEYFKIKPDF